MTNSEATKTYTGGCHCGAVRFEADLDLSNGGTMCNCTICAKLGGVTTVVKPSAFRLLAGEDSLSSYTWATPTSQRRFCKRCGVQCFSKGHVEELGGDFVSVTLNALDDFDRSTIKVRHWDGLHNNWQAGMRDTPWPVKA